MPDSSVDALAPADIAARVATLGVTKARRDALSLLLLSILAGAFIAVGALLSAVVATESTLGYGPTRLLAGAAFSVGLVLVVVAGAELFTGNNLVAMAWASRRIGGGELLRCWALTYVGNFLGALATCALALVGGVHEMDGGAVGITLSVIGAHKAGLDPWKAFALGVLCNALVCLAVWIAMAGRTVVDRIVGVTLPVTAFVALGFEHSVANMLFLPYALALDGFGDSGAVHGALVNLGIVTAGNLVGGTLLVATVYWTVYLRPGAASS